MKTLRSTDLGKAIQETTIAKVFQADDDRAIAIDPYGVVLFQGPPAVQERRPSPPDTLGISAWETRFAWVLV